MDKFPQIHKEGTQVTEVIMNTNKGAIKLELYPEIAPKTVENFIGLAKENYYDGVIFHRVISDFRFLSAQLFFRQLR